MADKDSMVGQKIQAVPAPDKEIGIDVDNGLAYTILDAAESSTLDLSVLDNFTNISQTRESVYSLIDTMAEDDAVASVLETYAEDVCEPNDFGQIMWCESPDDNTNKYVSYLLDAMNVDKHMYGWAHSLCKYGDTYFRIYRESDYGDDVLFNQPVNKTALNEDLNDKLADIDDRYSLDSEGNSLEDIEVEDGSRLVEDVNLKLHKEGDHYVNYLEAVPNPGEMFELTKFGKTKGFIKAPATIQNSTNTSDINYASQGYTQYKMKKKDVDVYQATDFVHACLEDNSSRVPEEVDIYTSDGDYTAGSNASTYNVKRGQSLLYNSFKIWREWKLLENSILLNRITKSSVVRILEVEVGDMPKEAIRNTLRNIKQMVEQKSALNTNASLSEYNNPGPVENTIYIPVHGDIGKISTQEIGSDSPDPKSLADIEYFRDKFYASLRVPKQFFNFTDDNAGFSGGQSLALISSRYGKAIKRIQNALIQAVTDAVNLMLIDRGMMNYVNKFTLKMQTPITQEVKDRKEAQNTEIGIIRDLSQVLNDQIEDPVLKLKILKELVTPVTSGTEVVTIIQQQIDLLEAPEEEEEEELPPTPEAPEEDVEEEENFPTPGELMGGEGEQPELTPVDNEGGEFGESLEEDADGEDYLPSFHELGVEDGADSSKF